MWKKIVHLRNFLVLCKLENDISLEKSLTPDALAEVEMTGHTHNSQHKQTSSMRTQKTTETE